MTRNDRAFLNWVKSKLGPLATLDNALALYDRTPADAPVGLNLTRKDISRDALVEMIRVRAGFTGVVDALHD